MVRLVGLKGCGTSYNFAILLNAHNKFKTFDKVIFKNGYGKNVPYFEIECKGIIVGQGRKKWGAPNHRVFIIKLGKIIKHE